MWTNISSYLLPELQIHCTIEAIAENTHQLMVETQLNSFYRCSGICPHGDSVIQLVQCNGCLQLQVSTCVWLQGVAWLHMGGLGFKEIKINIYTLS